MPFVSHIQAAHETWSQYVDGSTATQPFIVITTESRSILKELAAFQANNSSLKAVFDSQIVVNHRDIAQDTGYLEVSLPGNSSSATGQNDVLLSAMSSLKLQLTTRITLGNCCSNFHLMLKDLLYEGCGAHIENTFQCLQTHANARFRVCCSWDRSPECVARRNNTNNTMTSST